MGKKVIVKNPKIVAPVKIVVNEHSNIGDNPSIIGLPNSNDVNNPINVDSQPMIGSKFPSFPPPNIDISNPILIPIDILPNVGMPPPIAQGFNTNIYTPQLYNDMISNTLSPENLQQFSRPPPLNIPPPIITKESSVPILQNNIIRPPPINVFNNNPDPLPPLINELFNYGNLPPPINEPFNYANPPPPINEPLNYANSPPPINEPFNYVNSPPPINELFNHPNTPPPLLNRQYSGTITPPPLENPLIKSQIIQDIYTALSNEECEICEKPNPNYISKCGHYFHISCLSTSENFCVVCKTDLNLKIFNKKPQDSCNVCGNEFSLFSCLECHKNSCFFCITEKKVKNCCISLTKQLKTLQQKCPGCQHLRNLNDLVPISCKTHSLLCKKCWNLGKSLKACIICSEMHENFTEYVNCKNCGDSEIKYYGEYICMNNCLICEHCQTLFIIANQKSPKTCVVCNEKMIKKVSAWAIS